MGKKREDRFAYVEYEIRHGEFGVAICEEGVKGFRPVDDYGPYGEESRAEGIAERLNKRAGISHERATDIVRSTMPTGVSR